MCLGKTPYTAAVDVNERPEKLFKIKNGVTLESELHGQVYLGQTPYTTAIDVYSAAMTTWWVRRS